ncbi:stabilizer of axonemal microtubules 1 [Bufo gargarizans]|uniref:stabilizer of axonemal microtubules 1 n=1 Tax=Bufo gargarizans TaxID=30331 RepID=UPI001CF5B59A|nr:stabilizer of axonemal microtubules 1 [Bufo gargarizans]
MSPDLNPIEPLWGIIKRKVEEHKVYNIHQLCDVIMEERKKIPVVTCDYQLLNFSKTKSHKPANTYHPPKERFDMKTTFQDHFQFCPIRPRQSCKLEHLHTGCLPPIDFRTNYRIEYVPHHIEGIRIFKKEKYMPNEGPYDYLTTNRQDYKGLPGKEAKSLKPRYCFTGSDIPFSGLTEFQDKYQMWPLPPPLEKKSVIYKKPTDKINFISTSHYDYTPPILHPQVSYKPVWQYRRSSEAFEANSIMREDFKLWPCKKASLLRPQSNLGLPIGSFENTTTTRHDYLPHPPTHTKSFKPTEKRFRPLLPIDAQTIYSSSYTVKPFQICCTINNDLPKHINLEMDYLKPKQYRLQSEKGNKYDFNRATAVPLSAECSSLDNRFTTPREKEAMA